jgi:PAS domain S-box-containing protein
MATKEYQPPQGGDPKNINILCVDDESSLLELCKIFLERSGQFKVDTAISAISALDLLEQKTYHAIISDYQMPGMNGIEFLKSVRSSGNTIPFIIFTGKGREDVVIEALNEGADFYLQKGGKPRPQFAELEHKLNLAIQQRQAERNIRDLERRESDILNFLPDATFAIDVSGRIIVWNKAIEEMTGVPGADMLGKDNFEYALPIYGLRRPDLIDLVLKDDPGTASLYPFINEQGASLISEIIIPAFRDGEDKYLRFVASPFFDTDGNIIGAIESIRDITEWKLAEKELQFRNIELYAAYEQLAASEDELRQNYDEISKHGRMLRESEDKHRAIYENTGTATITIEEDTTISLVNAEFEKMSGFSREEIEGKKSWTEFVVNEDLDRIYAQHCLRRKDRNAALRQYEFRFLNKDGGIRDILLTVDAIPGTTKSVASLLDITDRKRFLTDLKMSEEKYRSLIDDIHGVYYRTDPEGNLVTARPQLLTMLGYHSFDELLGRPIAKTLFLEPDTYRDFYEALQEEGSITDHELTLRKRDGTPIVVMANGRYYYDEYGVVGGIEGIFLDFTEQKQVRTALRESEERFRNLMDYIPGVSVQGYTPDGTVRYWNKASEYVYGYTEEEAIGKNLADLIIPDDLRPLFAECLDIARQITESGEFMPPGELLLLHKDGHLVPVYSIHTAVCIKGEEPLLFCIDFDLSERKRVEEALRLANTRLNLLTSVTRHDIINQLTVLQANLDFASLAVEDCGTQIEHIRKADAAGDCISRLINFTKEYEQIGVSVPAWHDLGPLIDESIRDTTLGGVKFENHIPPGLLLFAEPMVAKVFYNLVENAVQYGGEITTVSFSAICHGDGLIIVCEDDGNGIAYEDKEKIFDRGYGKNTGLGLFLSREILAITGISIHETGEQGKGARFEIMVPEELYRFSE